MNAQQAGAAPDVAGKVALITGGAGGFGAGMARRLAAAGARIVVADVDDAAGGRLAEEVGGVYVHCDVSNPADSEAAVRTAVERFGGLDIAALNAGVSSPFGVGDDFDAERYRRVMGINLDGVVYGVHAALPALLARGGGDIVATASLGGLTPMPFDPFYATNKAAVVGLVRSLGPGLVERGVRVNALCPGFADTAIVAGARERLLESGIPLLTVEEVVDGFMSILAGTGVGECWVIQPGRNPEPYRFRGVPGPATRAAAGQAEGR